MDFFFHLPNLLGSFGSHEILNGTSAMSFMNSPATVTDVLVSNFTRPYLMGDHGEDLPEWLPEFFHHPYVLIPMCVLLILYSVMSMASVADTYLSPILVRFSDSLGLSEVVAGVTILAFGNAAPDIILGLCAASGGSEGDLSIYIGEVLGSSLFNVALIPAALIFVTARELKARQQTPLENDQTASNLRFPIPLKFSDALRDGLCILLAVSLVAGVLLPRKYTYLVYGGLITLYGLYLLIFILTNAFRNKTEEEEEEPAEVVVDSPAEPPALPSIFSSQGPSVPSIELVSSLQSIPLRAEAPHTAAPLNNSTKIIELVRHTLRGQAVMGKKTPRAGGSFVSQTRGSLLGGSMLEDAPASPQSPNLLREVTHRVHQRRGSVLLAPADPLLRDMIIDGELADLEDYHGMVKPRVVVNPELLIRASGGGEALSWLDRAELLLFLPVQLLFKITMPTLGGDEEVEEADQAPEVQAALLEGETSAVTVLPPYASRFLIVASPAFIFTFLWFTLLEQADCLLVPLLLAGGACSVILAPLLFVKYKQSTREKVWKVIERVFVCVSFFTALSWLKVFSGLIIASLKFAAESLNMPYSLLSVTLLSAGASCADVFAALAVAKVGRPMMALSAAFAAPVMNLLLGVASSLISLRAGHSTTPAEEEMPLLSAVDGPIAVTGLGLALTCAYVVAVTAMRGKDGQGRGLLPQDAWVLVGIFAASFVGAGLSLLF